MISGRTDKITFFLSFYINPFTGTHFQKMNLGRRITCIFDKTAPDKYQISIDHFYDAYGGNYSALELLKKCLLHSSGGTLLRSTIM